MVNVYSVCSHFYHRDDKINLFYSLPDDEHNPRFFVTETPILEVPTYARVDHL